MLKVNQLAAFNEVMLTGSISQAARNLRRTQSSVSATIAGLEGDLGMPLFERSGGRLHPVPEARYLHNECGEILRRIETVADNMHRMKSLQTGELHIASMPGPSMFLLPNLIARHCSSKSQIRTNLVSRSSVGIYRLMSGQRYDIGLADYMPKLSSEAALIETEVYELRCLCALPDNHPLLDRKTVTPADLAGLPLATLGQEHAVYSEVAGIFERYGLKPEIPYMTQYFLSLLNYVERGLACAIVDPITAESHRLYKRGPPKLHFRRLDPAVYFRIALLTPRHRPHSIVARHFTSVLKEALEMIREASRDGNDCPVLTPSGNR